MKFWETSTFRGVVLGALATCIGFLTADLGDKKFDFDPGWTEYVIVWLGAALATVNRARQGDVTNFPTFGP